MRENKLGPFHANIAVSANYLAGIYESQGELKKAEPWEIRSLEISEKTLGKNHPNVAASLNNLALLYANMGEYDLAVPLYRRALIISEKVFGPDHPNIAIALNNLGDLLEKKATMPKLNRYSPRPLKSATDTSRTKIQNAAWLRIALIA